MKNFRLVARDIDLGPIRAELAIQPDAWSIQTGRQEKIAVQREARSIPIRGLRKSKIGSGKRRDVHESRFTSLSRRFPEIVAFIQGFAGESSADLARAKVVKLPPRSVVLPHVDRGSYYATRDRYHLVLKSKGSWMRSGKEVVTMHEDELWWFDNKQEHEARNDTETERIHLIFDLTPRSDAERRSLS